VAPLLVDIVKQEEPQDGNANLERLPVGTNVSQEDMRERCVEQEPFHAILKQDSKG